MVYDRTNWNRVKLKSIPFRKLTEKERVQVNPED